METKELKEAKELYKTAPDRLKTTLELKFGKELLEGKLEIPKKEFHYTDIKTFEDACFHEGINVSEFFEKYKNLSEHHLAPIQLEIIIKAINAEVRNERNI